MGRARGTTDAFGRPVAAPQDEPPRRPARRVHARRLVALVAGLMVFALWLGPSGRDPVPYAVGDAVKAARTLPAGSGPPPLGMWTVNGRTLRSRGFSDATAKLNGRTWMVYERCPASCTRWIARTTSLAVQRAPLEQRAGRWMAVFNNRTDGCGTKETGRDRAVFVFSVTADQQSARAVEVNSATFPGCHASVMTALPGIGELLGRRSDHHATSRVAWTARRSSPNCDGMPTCREVSNHAATYTDDEQVAIRRATAACVRTGVARSQCGCAIAGALNWITPAQVQAAAEAIVEKRQATPSSAAAISRALRSCDASGGS